MSQLLWSGFFTLLGIIGGVLAAYLKERLLDAHIARFSERRNKLVIGKRKLFKAAIKYLEENPSAAIELRMEANYVLSSTTFLIIGLAVISLVMLFLLQILAIVIQSILHIDQIIVMALGTILIIVLLNVIVSRIGRRLFYYVQLLNELDRRRTSLIWPIIAVANDPKALVQNRLSPFDQQLIIHHAEYGADDQTMDVTGLLRSKVQNEHLVIRANKDDMGDDPAKYKEKQLQVYYSYKGNRNMKTVAENELLSIP